MEDTLSLNPSFYSRGSPAVIRARPRKVTTACLIGNTRYDGFVLEAVQRLGLNIFLSETGEEYKSDPRVIFVLESFDEEEFTNLGELPWRIYGSVVLLECARLERPLPVKKRPIFCLLMDGVVTCFTQFTTKECKATVEDLILKIRAMGGSVREAPTSEMSHLIARTTNGKKYNYARTFNKPIMSINWVYECWKLRYHQERRATEKEIIEANRLNPFCGVVVYFVGFPKTEEEKMKVILLQYEGQLLSTMNETCTHLVADEDCHVAVPQGMPGGCFIVRAEWFWNSVYRLTRALETDFLVPPEHMRKPPMRRSVKRRHPSEVERRVPSKRTCSKDDEDDDDDDEFDACNSPEMISSFNEAELFPSTPLNPIEENVMYDDTSKVSSLLNRQLSCSLESLDSNTPQSRRMLTFKELVQTESNYVDILNTILQMRIEALNPSDAGGPLLSQTQAKIIFGNLMPIGRTHHAILKDLKALLDNWCEEALIGDVFIKYSPDLFRDYAPYVSSFEESKSTLFETMDSNPRFHAYLRIKESKPECGRQGLHELMIRPIQRLGSCKLLLREILKHTPEDNPDRPRLELAIGQLSDALSLINEDKKKMDSLCLVFDIYNIIAHCPADVIAAHRSLILQFEAVELSNHGFSRPGDYLVIYVFTDIMLVCKMRGKAVVMRGPQSDCGLNFSNKIMTATNGKPLKFLQSIPLTNIHKIVDVTNSENCSGVLGIEFRGKTELRMSDSYFIINDHSLDKSTILRRFCGALAVHSCVADPENFVQNFSAEKTGLTISPDILMKPFRKASKVALKTQCFLTNALGLSRTPRNGKISPAPSMTSLVSSSSPSKLTSHQSTSGLPVHYNLAVEKPVPPPSLTAAMIKRM